MIVQLAGLINESDLGKLDQYLATSTAHQMDRKQHTHSECVVKSYQRLGATVRLDLTCSAPSTRDEPVFALTGRLFFEGGTLTEGTIDRLAVNRAYSYTALRVTDTSQHQSVVGWPRELSKAFISRVPLNGRFSNKTAAWFDASMSLMASVTRRNSGVTTNTPWPARARPSRSWVVFAVIRSSWIRHP